MLAALAMGAGVILAGCSGNGKESAHTSIPGVAPTQQDTAAQRTVPFGSGMTDYPSYFSDTQIEAAARIFVRVQRTKETLREKDSKKRSANEATRAYLQIQEARREAVSKEPTLTPREMEYLLHRAKWDRTLRQEFFQAIQEEGGTPPSPFSSRNAKSERARQAER